MGKTTPISRTLLLAAMAGSGVTAFAQDGGVTANGGQVYYASQVVDGGTYVIKNVGDAAGRQGWAFADNGQIRIDVTTASNDVTTLTDDKYIFTAEAVSGQDNTFRFRTADGNYMTSGTSGQVTTSAEGTSVTVVAKAQMENTPRATIFNLQVPGSYLNVNAPSGDAYGYCVAYNSAGDANGKWALYAVNETTVPSWFETSTAEGESWTGSEHWYTLYTRGAYWAYNATSGKIEVNATTADISDNAYLWCISGNATDGYKIYNKAAGPGMPLTISADNTNVDILEGEGSLLDGQAYPNNGGNQIGGFCFKL